MTALEGIDYSQVVNKQFDVQNFGRGNMLGRSANDPGMYAAKAHAPH